jgi:FtsH-binding integral membrane protein
MLSFLQGMPFGWLLFLGAFMVTGWLATRVAHSSPSKPLQYLALSGYVFAQALLFLPVLWIADRFAPGVISSAALVTFVGFAALTAIVFFTRKDFSFLRSILLWGGVIALVAIVAAVLFGASLGTWFSVLMIAFAGAAILYDTSNVLHHYPLLFWYVLRLFMASRN